MKKKLYYFHIIHDPKLNIESILTINQNLRNAKIASFVICAPIAVALSKTQKISIPSLQNVLITPTSANGMDKRGIYLLKSVVPIVERQDLFLILKK
jgi:hypothetical protein